MDQLDANMDQGSAPEENVESMEMLLAQEGMGLDVPKRGEIRTGVIASINNGQILVSVGTKSEGIISSREYEQIPDEEKEAFDIGQEIQVYVINPEDQHGNLVLSYLRAREATDWDDVETLRESKDGYESTIIGYNKGGLLVKVGGLSGFVPASQLGLARRARIKGDTPDKRWGGMVGEKIEVRVIEVDRNRRRLILSERAASSETRESLKERVIEDLEVGQVYKGRVTSLASFGAFVNVNGADGLVHLSEISWDRIQDPSEVLEVGQEVKVKVISIQKEKKRIGLSIRQLLADPWIDKAQQYEVGQMVQCKITRLTSFGAFAEIEPGLEGLIHISELADHRVEHPKEVLHEGDMVNLRVIKIEPEEHRIGLSLRRVESMKYADMDWKDLLDDLGDDADFGDDDDIEEEDDDVEIDEEELDEEE
ncbi:MAG: S1 RNA-binding domain-containing protein [Anaerolineae bacterium]|jgi:small subunit ribosomal protein S1|nr:S1 RNA-binding domain-containing protein [Anaerolineae bacterium]